MQLRSNSLNVVAAAMILVALAACDTSDSASEVTGTTLGPHDTAAEVRPDLIIVEPSQVQAGDLASVYFPDERTRGVHFVLESSTDDGWNLEYHLISDWSGDRAPTSHRADSMDIAIEDIGFSGGGPDVISIPAEASPGAYRVCTGNSRPNICALLTVESGA